LIGGEVLNPWKGRRSEDDEVVDESDVEQPIDVDPDVLDDPESAVDADEVEAGNDEDARADLEAEVNELKDRHLRLAAEFENFRKRTRKEHAESRAYAQADLVNEVLPTLDDLARVADIPNESTTVEALDEGVELILRNLRKMLDDAGLAQIDALEQPFNPEFHQGILTVDVDDEELDNTVSRVFVQGYTFLDRLVRPAQVEVRQFVEDSETEAEIEIEGSTEASAEAEPSAEAEE
jgi:molecular chaperone GrpE